MRTNEHQPTGSSDRQDLTRPFSRELGCIAFIAGSTALAFAGFGAAWQAGVEGSKVPVWGYAAFFGGLGAMPIGAGLLTWTAVIRFRSRGPLAAISAAIGGLAIAAVTVVATFLVMGLLTQGRT